MLFDCLDDFVAVTGLLAQQQQDDQLQVSRGEHLRRARAGAASAETTAEGAAEESASAATAELPVAASPDANMV
jgi:hypothetical protein